jgi:16S rRNA (adenine1518-N6/adenine1519-N6)-dimethyltransferase
MVIPKQDSAPRPPLRDIIQVFNLKPDKSLGQHFLLDPHLLASLTRHAEPLAGVNVIEIGPGPGGLTRALLASTAEHRLTILQADALKTDLTQLTPAPRAIVANLPYNIGTPLLISWLAQAAHFQSFTLMFQLEVAERICAEPNTAPYGRISVLTQWLCQAAIVQHIPASAFSPPPKVDSALIHIIPKPTQPTATEFKTMERLTAAAFGQRRKMLRGALKPLGGETLLQAANLDPTRRAETLTVQEFERLVQVLLSK